MKLAQILTVAVSGVLSAFFLTVLVLFAYNYHYDFNVLSDSFVYNLLVIQTAVLFSAACAVLAVAVVMLCRKIRDSSNIIEKLVLLTDMNAPADECNLSGRMSVMIGRNVTSHISFDTDTIAYEYAVVNRVKNAWYIERVSDGRSVGLKRAGEQFVYKLKPGLYYKLQINDVIYIEKERLMIGGLI